MVVELREHNCFSGFEVECMEGLQVNWGGQGSDILRISLCINLNATGKRPDSPAIWWINLWSRGETCPRRSANVNFQRAKHGLYAETGGTIETKLRKYHKAISENPNMVFTSVGHLINKGVTDGMSQRYGWKKRHGNRWELAIVKKTVE